ncbi:hypothetical protein [Saccharothrix sp. Mg75]|uniref:WXG100 family type VII secretion target n=1 Tax=Saccharothrix sp. Mg75 TaxID=3445357 RepID=UPI003EE8E6A6
MATPSWNDVKAVLDDPNVSEDKKAELMHAYVSDTAPWSIPDDANAYKDRYDTSSFWNWGDGASADNGLQGRYDEAKAEGESNSYNSREQTKAVEDGEKALDGKQPPTAAGTGVKLSDELFDAGKAGLKVFEKFEPIWNNRPGDCVGNTHSLNLAEHINKPYDEQRGINFHKLLMEADEFSAAKSRVDELKSEVDAQLKGLYGEWEGAAAQASQEHYSGELVPKVTELGDALNGAADLTRTAVGGVYELCKSKADEVLGMYREQIGQADTFMAEKVVSFARGEGDYSKDRVLEIAGWVDSKTGSNIADRIHSDDCTLNDENRDYAINQCKKWIRDSFNTEFWGLYEQFKQCCAETKSSVDAKWDTLANYMAGFENPFPAPASDPGDDGTGGGTGTGTGGGTGGGGGGTGSGGGGGGMPSGGGGSGSGGGGGVPEMPKPENPLDKDGDGKPDALQVPGDLDGDGKPDDLDGDGKPDDLDGDGKPDDQQGGKPDGLKGEEENPETVTIKSGDNEIKITEPDANGHVKITVDTPQSEPKTYDVDFSNNPDALKALMGQNGGAALAGALAGATTASGGVAGAGAAGAAAGANTLFAPGENAGQGGSDAAIPIEAGADGKALIELDGLAITAEVDPLTGEINLSVDNGDGSPEQYGVEFGEDDPDAGSDAAATPNLPSADRPGDVTTMPAPADRLESAIGAAPGFTAPEVAAVPVADSGFAGGFTEPQGAPVPVADGGPAASAFGGFTEPQGAPTPAAGVPQPGPGFGPAPGFDGGGGGGFGGGPGAGGPGGGGPAFGPAPGFDGGGGGGFGGHGGGGGGFGAAPAFDGPVQYNTEGTTSASGASVLGGGPSGFNGADSVLGGSPSGSDSTWSAPNSADQGLASDTNASQAGQAGSATLPSMHDGSTAGQPGGSAVGGGMMGGMAGGTPAAGGQQGGGGDDERRSPGQWRTTGSLFDDDVALSRVQGVLGEERR